jgi:hypothetical protein
MILRQRFGFIIAYYKICDNGVGGISYWGVSRKIFIIAMEASWTALEYLCYE